jgi:hypothetical protein
VFKFETLIFPTSCLIVAKVEKIFCQSKIQVWLILSTILSTLNVREMMFAVVTCFGVVRMKVLFIKCAVRTCDFCTNASIGRGRTF